MAYLPFYITPEEFAAEQAKQKQAIESGQQLKQWTRHNIEEPDRFIRIKGCSIPILGLFLLFSFMFYLEPTMWLFIVTLIPWLLFSYAVYLSGGVDERYEYTLSEHGLYYTKRRAEPTWLPKVLHIGAWFGVVGCVIAVVFIGPMALTGAGGCLLLSFVMVKNKYQPNIDVQSFQTEDILFIKFNVKRKVIVIYHLFDTCYYRDIQNTIVVRNRTRGKSYLFCQSEEQLKSIINWFQQDIAVECYEISDLKSIFVGLPPSLKEIPVVGGKYLLEETQHLRESNAPLPEPIKL